MPPVWGAAAPRYISKNYELLKSAVSRHAQIRHRDAGEVLEPRSCGIAIRNGDSLDVGVADEHDVRTIRRREVAKPLVISRKRDRVGGTEGQVEIARHVRARTPHPARIVRDDS